MLDIYDIIYLSTAVGLTPSGSSTVHIYTQTIHSTTQIQTIHRTTQLTRATQITTNLEECGPCPIFASFTLALALQLRKNTVSVYFILCIWIHFCEKGSIGFTRILKGYMAQKKAKNPCLRLYNNCTSTFIKEKLFLTFKCQWVHKYFVALNFKISFLKKKKRERERERKEIKIGKIWAIWKAVVGQGAKFWWTNDYICPVCLKQLAINPYPAKMENMVSS